MVDIGGHVGYGRCDMGDVVDGGYVWDGEADRDVLMICR